MLVGVHMNPILADGFQAVKEVPEVHGSLLLAVPDNPEEALLKVSGPTEIGCLHHQVQAVLRSRDQERQVNGHHQEVTNSKFQQQTAQL